MHIRRAILRLGPCFPSKVTCVARGLLGRSQAQPDFGWMITKWSQPPVVANGPRQQPVPKEAVSAAQVAARSALFFIAAPAAGWPAVTATHCRSDQLPSFTSWAASVGGPRSRSGMSLRLTACHHAKAAGSFACAHLPLSGERSSAPSSPKAMPPTWKCCSSPSQVSCRWGGACRQDGNGLQVERTKVSLADLDHST